ncbi:MAG: HigA family addiction module antidote protein [Alphaproteobacteria bacterium]|nr:HigA family addiction module antidote protein [Alphaproteobacteria bacterium]
MKNNLPPVHPGNYIREAISEMAFSQAEIAGVLDISPQYLSDIINGRKGLTPEMCFKLPEVMGSTPEFWADLQKTYDLKKAEADKGVAGAKDAVRKRFFELSNVLAAELSKKPEIKRVAYRRVTGGKLIAAKVAPKSRSKDKERA